MPRSSSGLRGGGPLMAVAAGVLTTLLYWWVWGAVRPVPALHDEAAYLLQARIFAGGHWTAPGRPLPEFFDQFYVLVTPVLASRYPPGHSLLLALGQLVGWPVLVPLILHGVTGGLVFAIASRVGGPFTGGLSWALWLLAPINLTFRPTYLSNVTTSATWVIGWWAILRWTERRAVGWTILLGICVGWCVITRPLTGLIFALSLTWPLVATARRSHLGRQVCAAGLSATIVSLLLPLANQRTTGSWSQLPWSVYSRQYMPYDRLGLGLDSTPPLRPINSELRVYNRLAIPFRREHVTSALPRIAVERAWRISQGMWGFALPLLLPAAILGLVRAPRHTRWTLWAVVLLFALHLGYAHAPQWTVYYMDALPVLAFFTAVGLVSLAAPGQPAGGVQMLLRLAAGALVALWLLLAAVSLPDARLRSLRLHRPVDTFAQRLSGVHADRAIVFVRHEPRPSPNVSLVTNEPDLGRARLWIVHDLGPRDTALIRLGGGRTAYLYEEGTHTLKAWTVTDTSAVKPPPR